MRPALRLLHRQPSIKFVGKRSVPSVVDHTPHVHPASPCSSLPDSFASYRQKAQQHGPLGGQRMTPRAGRSGASLGAVTPPKGEFFDRSELPNRFRRTPFSAEEIDAIETGGASLFH